MRLYDPALLDCIVAIAEEGSFQRAAARLGLTQSAVSQRVHSLETHAGTILVVRDRPVRFTPAGEVMLRHARKAKSLAADVKAALRDLLAAEAA
jgi:LysR family transcriptional regulator (chromosome initiation inhibitor)